MPRFAILFHETPAGYLRLPHWDLLLERGAGLWCWALAEVPQPGIEVVAQRLPDHRPMYLDYEGPIAGDRGTVSRWDAGTYEIVESSDERIVVELQGEKLSGSIQLTRDTDGSENWRVTLTG